MTLDELRELHPRWQIAERNGRVVATSDEWATETAATAEQLHERLARIDEAIARSEKLP